MDHEAVAGVQPMHKLPAQLEGVHLGQGFGHRYAQPGPAGVIPGNVPRHAQVGIAMQVLLDRPLGLIDRLKTIYAGLLLRDMSGWWRVLMFGRTGTPPDNFAALVAELETAAAQAGDCGITLEETAAMLAVLAWTPKPVEFEWFATEVTLGKGIWVDAFIDTQIRGLELDGWRVESWLYPTQTYHRRLVVHACRRIAEQGPER